MVMVTAAPIVVVVAAGTVTTLVTKVVMWHCRHSDLVVWGYSRRQAKPAYFVQLKS